MATWLMLKWYYLLPLKLIKPPGHKLKTTNWVLEAYGVLKGSYATS